MDWKLAWTEQAFSAGNTAVLKLLLRYPSQMDETQPCQQFMSTLSHAMSNGASLTSLHKAICKVFVLNRTLSRANGMTPSKPNDALARSQTPKTRNGRKFIPRCMTPLTDGLMSNVLSDRYGSP